MFKLITMPLIKFLLVMVFAGLTTAATDDSSQPSNAQNTVSNKQELFSFIRCHRQAKNIVINWGTTSIAGVNHFVIYHSELGDFYDPIGEVWLDGTLKYTYKHESVFAGYHYYYVAAVMNSGSDVNSAVDIVRIVGH